MRGKDAGQGRVLTFAERDRGRRVSGRQGWQGRVAAGGDAPLIPARARRTALRRSFGLAKGTEVHIAISQERPCNFHYAVSWRSEAHSPGHHSAEVPRPQAMHRRVRRRPARYAATQRFGEQRPVTARSSPIAALSRGMNDMSTCPAISRDTPLLCPSPLLPIISRTYLSLRLTCLLYSPITADRKGHRRLGEY